jgi:Methyltransferase domain
MARRLTSNRVDGVRQASAFLNDLPNVHERGDRPAHSGGLNPRLGQVMIDEIGKLEGAPRSIETGAGNSTLLFMMLGCSAVTAIAPDEKLGQRIHSEAAERGLDDGVLRFINDRSERALPRLALDDKAACEVGFIDGNHGWPSVFVDFCYLNMMLTLGGVLFVDDVHVYACAQLMLLLREQPEFELISLVGKMATFRKLTYAEFLPDWRGEPFILANTTGVILGG